MQPQHSKIDYLLVELIVRQIIYQWLNYLTSSKQLTTLFKYQISQNPLFKSTTTLFPNIVFVALKIKEEFYSSSLSLFLDPMLICFFPPPTPLLKPLNTFFSLCILCFRNSSSILSTIVLSPSISAGLERDPSPNWKASQDWQLFLQIKLDTHKI